MSTPTLVINELPNEILGSIFFRAASYPQICGIIQPSDPLCAITLVCAQWHRVAVCTPSLWTHIDLFQPEGYVVNDIRWILTRTRRWLERSKGCPLHVHIEGSMPVELIHEAFKLIEPYVQLIHTLELDDCNLLDSEPSLSLFRSLLSTHGALNYLTCYELCLYRFQNPNTEPIFGSDAQPSGLNEFHFCCIAIPPSFVLVDTMTALTHCLKLHTLRLVLDRSRDPFESLIDVQLPALRLLELRVFDDSLAASIASRLILGKQELDVIIPAQQLNVEGVFGLLARSKVVTLIFWDFDRLPGDDLNQYIACVPHLRALVLNFKSYRDSPLLVQLLSLINDETRKLLPSLQALSIESCHIRGPSMAALRGVLGHLRLRFIGFRNCYFQPKYDIRQVQQQYMIPGVPAISNDFDPLSPLQPQSRRETSPVPKALSDGSDGSSVREASNDLLRQKEPDAQTKRWLSSRFEEVILLGGCSYATGKSEDPYIQRLLQVA